MRSKIILLALAFVLCLFFSCRSKAHDGLTLNPGVLLIGIEIGFPPMEYYGPDGRTLMGFSVDMSRAIAEKLELEAKFIDVSWEGIFSGLETQRYDCIISSVTLLPERLLKYNFSKPYIVDAMTIISRKDSPFKPQNPQELEGLAVAYQVGTTSKFFMDDLAKNGLKYSSFSYDKIASCFAELSLNRIDVIVADGIVAMEYAKNPDSIYEITWKSEPKELFAICIKKENDTLTEVINNALEELFEDGVMVNISLEHLGVDMVTQARNYW